MTTKILCAVAFATIAYASACAAQPDSVLTLAEAQERALAGHPALAATRAQLDAARARREDAGRLRNPVLTAEVENFGATSARGEATLRLGQTLELGGDRGARADLASAQVALIEADGGGERRAVLAQTAARFLDAWAAQERLLALREAERLATEAVRAADARHRAGAALVTERVRAEGQKAMRTLERAKAEAELALARRLLAAQWGDSVASFGRLDPGAEPAAPAADALARHPQRARAAAELAVQEARLREAHAARVPDLDLEFGVRRLSETQSTGFLAGVALPLPLWNAQGSGVAAAEAEIAAVRARAGSAERSLLAEFESARAQVEAAAAAREELVRIQAISQDALRQVGVAYRAGRLGYTDLVDAQRALREADLAITEATVELWRARIALQRLAGEER